MDNELRSKSVKQRCVFFLNGTITIILLLVAVIVLLLRVGVSACSSPEMHVDYNRGMDIVQGQAPQWFPQPVVIWTSRSITMDKLSALSNTSFKRSSDNMTMQVVLHTITESTTYTCVIKNSTATATGDIKVTESNIKTTDHLQLLNMTMASASSCPFLGPPTTPASDVFIAFSLHKAM
ncbi:V-set domain-containing T-cell activation inhibitor 1 [Carettochelys insculpta]|uniref:V-set domain-containing T-cell activation inhibitor 1 n=1 Tax=Carettochelys insculpta TaxID=44489 RepID=UPI003EB7CE30